MRMPRFTHSLHFRMSALFLVLLSLSIAGFYLWIDATIFSAYDSKEEEVWFQEKEEPELVELATQISGLMEQGQDLENLLQSYGKKISPYHAEVVLFDTLGFNLFSTSTDSLALAVKHVTPSLLQDMSTDEWDFSSYPEDTDIDAYANRIIDVASVYAPGDADSTAVAYLAASFTPITVAVGEMDSDWRSMGFRALALVLIYAIITALIIMAWTSRRIRGLSKGVETFSRGDFNHRVSAGSADEIGALGRHFNTMATRIQTMMEELGAKEQFQRQLIANVSHDLRTPLASLRGYIETLSLDPDNLNRNEKNHYLDIISKNLNHLDQLIERTLILSRLESGQAHFRREDFPLGELIDSVLARCKTIAADARITLEFELDEDPLGYLVSADALQISQALQNLVENGIKFNHQGGKVSVRIIPGAERIEVLVSDNGIGIPPEDLPYIFDRFYIGEKSRTRAALQKNDQAPQPFPTSNGLGLAIAHKIITSHGSELNVTSEAGRGTVFRFYLNRAQPVDQRSKQADV